VDCGTERGELGDRNRMLTGVGDRQQRPDFGGGSGTGGLRFEPYKHTKRRQRGLDGNDQETVD
jgi:hypothetical protein